MRMYFWIFALHMAKYRETLRNGKEKSLEKVRNFDNIEKVSGFQGFLKNIYELSRGLGEETV